MNRTAFLLTILTGYSLFFFFQFPLGIPFLLFVIGLLIGYTFHIWDRVFQVFIIPELAQQRREFISRIHAGQMMRAFRYLVKHVSSMVNSFYFLCLYFPLTFYLISSSGSIVGTGLMLGLGLSYCVHFILSYKKVKEARNIYFQPLSAKVKDSDIQKLMSTFITVFVILSIVVIF
jgi:hypothetical protein